jgi:hypothetical protein
LTDPERETRSHRALNAAIYASTLTVINAPLDLDLLEPAARARDLLMTLSIRESVLPVS